MPTTPLSRRRLAQSKKASADLESRLAQSESEALAARVQADSQLGQLALAQKRAEQADEFVSRLTAEVAAARETKAEAAATSSAMHAEVAAERALLASQLEQARSRVASLQEQTEQMAVQQQSAAGESAARTHQLELTVQQLERHRETYKQEMANVRAPIHS